MPKNVRGANPKPGKKWKCPPDGKNLIFVHSAIDEYGFNLYEFRILAHVARRAGGKQGCYASQKKIGEVCGISQRKVLEVLAILCDANVLYKEKAEGRRTNSYRLNVPSEWKNPSELNEIRERRSKQAVSKNEQSK